MQCFYTEKFQKGKWTCILLVWHCILMFVCVCVFVQCGWRGDLQPVRVRSGGRGLQWGRREEAHEADPGGSLLPPPEQRSPPRPEGQRIHTNMFLCCCEVSSDKTSSIVWGHVMEKCKNMNSKYMTVITVDTLTNTSGPCIWWHYWLHCTAEDAHVSSSWKKIHQSYIRFWKEQLMY